MGNFKKGQETRPWLLAMPCSSCLVGSNSCDPWSVSRVSCTHVRLSMPTHPTLNGPLRRVLVHRSVHGVQVRSTVDNEASFCTVVLEGVHINNIPTKSSQPSSCLGPHPLLEDKILHIAGDYIYCVLQLEEAEPWTIRNVRSLGRQSRTQDCLSCHAKRTLDSFKHTGKAMFAIPPEWLHTK